MHWAWSYASTVTRIILTFKDVYEPVFLAHHATFYLLVRWGLPHYQFLSCWCLLSEA